MILEYDSFASVCNVCESYSTSSMTFLIQKHRRKVFIVNKTNNKENEGRVSPWNGVMRQQALKCGFSCHLSLHLLTTQIALYVRCFSRKVFTMLHCSTVLMENNISLYTPHIGHCAMVSCSLEGVLNLQYSTVLPNFGFDTIPIL